MNNQLFYIVDVFAEEKYAGNELAVVRRAAPIPDLMMQKIAREMNFSETTFVLKDEESRGGFDVRIFTPTDEVPFAGHPTLGTAYIIQHEILQQPINEVVLNLKIGPIPVTFTYRGQEPDILWMKQVKPRFGKTLEAHQLASVLGLESSDIEKRCPIQEVSTGLPFIIVPLKTLEAVKKSRVHQDKMLELVKGLQAKAMLVFCPETYSSQNDLNVRVFAGAYGVPIFRFRFDQHPRRAGLRDRPAVSFAFERRRQRRRHQHICRRKGHPGGERGAGLVCGPI
jgi:trans-2,3-dihydro-3-hydroxyanthranilate isomerase